MCTSSQGYPSCSHGFSDARECLVKWRTNFSGKLRRWGGNFVLTGGTCMQMLPFEPLGKIWCPLKSTEVSSLATSEYIVLDFNLAFMFITTSHCLQLSSIILQCLSSFFPLFLFFTFCPPSFSKPVYLTMVKNFKETGRRCLLWPKRIWSVLGVLDLPSPSQGQLKPLHWPQKCGAPVWTASSSHQHDKATEFSWVHLSLPPLWVPHGMLSPSMRNHILVQGPVVKETQRCSDRIT